MKNKKRVFLIAFVVIIAWLVWSNITIKTTKYTIADENLPDSFDGYRIVQISDLHNALFGKDNNTLVKKVKKQDPDMIVLTGDIVDGDTGNLDNLESFFKKLVEIAPCYYVTGNHEAYLDNDKYDDVIKVMDDTQVKVLFNEMCYLEKNEEKLFVLGYKDPGFDPDILEVFPCDDVYDFYYDQISGESKKELEDYYTIALSHRPEAFKSYVKNNINLVFTGHAHGGQFRLPFVGGLVAPGQGFFPKYDAGVYSEGNTHMVVSRGLGNSLIPVRINNRPELVVVTLKKK